MSEEQYEKVLPKFMRDFHDQKDLFKSIQSHFCKNEENKIPNNWVDNHVYVIDFFLWFMAQHGYKLSKFKSKKFPQYDIDEFISAFKNRQAEQFKNILMGNLPTESQSDKKEDSHN